MLLREALNGHRLTFLTGVEELVEELDRLFGSELYGPHPAADEPLLHDRDALLELRNFLFERAVRFLGAYLASPSERQLVFDACSSRDRRDDRRRIRDDDEEVLRHDVRRLREALDELDVLPYLDAHEVVELIFVGDFQSCDVGADVEHARLHEYLAGEVERVEEVLELHDERRLLVFGFEREVER